MSARAGGLLLLALLALWSLVPGDASARTRGASRAPESAAAAADVVRSYYAAIAAGSYRRAYALWGSDGAASRKTYRQFAAGFANTAKVRAEIGLPGRIEGAAGSRFVEVPVTVRAVTRSGERQRFSGRYVMRRMVVDGATEAQRRWHIDSAHLRRVRS